MGQTAADVASECRRMDSVERALRARKRDEPLDMHAAVTPQRSWWKPHPAALLFGAASLGYADFPPL